MSMRVDGYRRRTPKGWQDDKRKKTKAVKTPTEWQDYKRMNKQ